MAYENIRQVVANALSNKLYEQSRRGKASILGQELSNQLLSKQLDDLLPLQIEQLSKTIDFMISPEEKLQQALTMKRADSIIKQNELKTEYGLRDYLAEQTAKYRAQYPTKSIVEYEGLTRGSAGGRTPMTLEEEAQDYVLKGFDTNNVDRWYKHAKATGERNLGLLGNLPEKSPPRDMAAQIKLRQTLVDSQIDKEWDNIPKDAKVGGGKGFLRGDLTPEERESARNILMTKTDKELADAGLSKELRANIASLKEWAGQAAETNVAPAPTNTLEDKIQMFMKANNISSRDEAVEILRSEGIIQ